MAKPLLLPSPGAAPPAARLLRATPPLRLRAPTFLNQPQRAPPQSRNLCPSVSAAAVPTTTTKRGGRPVISEGRDEDARRAVCPGCGVFMQEDDPDLPGFFTNPSRRSPSPQDEIEQEAADSSPDGFLEDEGDGDSPSESDLAAELDGLDTGFLESLEEGEDEEDEDEEGASDGEPTDGLDAESGWDSDWDDDGMEDDEEEKWRRELDGFTPPGVGYGNITEETLERLRKEKLSKAERRRRAREAKRAEAREDSAAVVCARCHSLRNYGHVRNHIADNLIPDFDFDRFISSRLVKRSAGTPVIVMVVDCADFDGSFPKKAARSLFKALEGRGSSKLSETPRLVLVGTKVDLLPWEQMGVRLEKWVRGRAKALGAPKLDAVYLVSVHKDLSVRNLIAYVKELAGPRSNVWVIGAQNAGKSTLINAFAKKQGVKITRLTEAAVPGTTLGILRMTGVLPAKAKVYDTPGLLHPYIMSMRLNSEERKMVEIRKELRPRTFRVKAGQSVHIGGLTRLDVLEASVQTIYVTVWASASISLHLGKTETAEELRSKHVGIRLQPPVAPERATELGQWTERRIEVSGISWDMNSTDIAVSGLGWYSLGLKGRATVSVHTFDGIDVTQRDAMILHRAKFLERPGFLLPIAIANAIGEETRKKNERMKGQQSDDDDLLDDESSE
ncbi:GTP-binding protein BRASSINAZOLE INSENSITIVE PALE GREEN 2, chloroplastic [Lolium rigidum]|uniref:GTP-binding protein BRASSINAZOLE INSENSITIVE PALE GREEN 2, chloroplastic n=1 Tax=Lolium rigidum TaxID=89674 RepID=UPI001F5C64E5|nr:GTP-binding protein BRASSINAZOLE INSENSITIVE PALE GREEN 2, chloroplastic [Lolium rigidum]